MPTALSPLSLTICGAGMNIALSLSVLIHKMGVVKTTTGQSCWILRTEWGNVCDINTSTHFMKSSLQGSPLWPGRWRPSVSGHWIWLRSCPYLHSLLYFLQLSYQHYIFWRDLMFPPHTHFIFIVDTITDVPHAPPLPTSAQPTPPPPTLAITTPLSVKGPNVFNW